MRTIAILVILLAVVMIACAPTADIPIDQPSAITSFEQCVAAGNPVMESYPRQCAANGRTFTETVPLAGPADEPDVDNTDVVTGNIVEGDVVDVRIEAYDWGFEPSTVTVRAGQTVRLTVTSREGEHGISIPAFNVKTGEFGPGETKTVEFVADKAGEYPFFCNVFCGSGHKEMRGTLLVE